MKYIILICLFLYLVINLVRSNQTLNLTLSTNTTGGIPFDLQGSNRDPPSVLDYKDVEAFYCCTVYSNTPFYFYNIDNNDTFVKDRKIIDIFYLKYYYMSVYTIEFPKKFCLWGTNNTNYAESEYKEVYLPWLYKKRWVKKQEFTEIINTSFPCVCTMSNQYREIRDWIVYDEQRSVIWIVYKENVYDVAGTFISCAPYDSISTVEHDGRQGIRLLGYEDVSQSFDKRFQNPGYVDDQRGFSLNYTRCNMFNRTEYLISKDIVYFNFDTRKYTTTINSITTQNFAPLYKLSRCLCVHDNPEKSIGYLVNEIECVFIYNGIKNLLSSEILFGFLHQPYLCDETQTYDLNDTHIIQCHMGYRFSIFEKKYLPDWTSTGLSFTSCEHYLIIDENTDIFQDDETSIYDTNLDTVELLESNNKSNVINIPILSFRDNINNLMVNLGYQIRTYIETILIILASVSLSLVM